MKRSYFNQIKTAEHRNLFTSSYPKERETLTGTSQETEIDIKKVNVMIQWWIKNKLEIVYNIEHKSNYIYLLLHFFFFFFYLILFYSIVKSSIYMVFFDNSESDTEWPDFSTLKSFNIEPRKKVYKLYTLLMSIQSCFGQTEVWP